jgi:TRAP-type C4-dicarboxylate transport system permease small subunit
VLETVERALRRVSIVFTILAGIGLTMMMLHICADIISKYVLDKPIVATLEIVTWYYMVMIVIFPIGYIQVIKKHLMVELFTLKMSPARLSILEGIVGVLGAVYVAILCYLTFGHAVEQTISGEIQDATYFDMPVWPSRWILPLSTGLMALVCVVQAIRDFRFGLTGRGTPSTPPKDVMIVE